MSKKHQDFLDAAKAWARAEGEAVPGPPHPEPDASVHVFVRPRRNFIIVYGEPGRQDPREGHYVGGMFNLAAQTHLKELKANTPPNSSIPATVPTDNVTVSAIHTVSDLIAQLSVNNVQYLAYFGHGWNDTGSVGYLEIGQNHVADSNLSTAGDFTCTSPSNLPQGAFLSGAVIFLFCCRAAFGADSSAEQIATALGGVIQVFGYDRGSHGSMFTADKTLGHGGKAATFADQNSWKTHPITGGDVWMVPFDGVPTFKSFP